MSAQAKPSEIPNKNVEKILDRLTTRPFHKMSLGNSKSMKTFFANVIEEGFEEDMLIFEPNFVKKYRNFSKDYCDKHFKYSSTSNVNNEFLYMYNKIVKPRRWQRVYRDIQDDYTKSTKEAIFNDPAYQEKVFSSEKKPNNFRVFQCQPTKNKKNLIMLSIQHKIRKALYERSNEFLQQKFDQYKKRKEERKSLEQILPPLTFEDKKQQLLEEINMKRNNKRDLSEAMLKEITRNYSSLLQNQDSTQISKNKDYLGKGQESTILGQLINQSSFIKIDTRNLDKSRLQPSFDSEKRTKLPQITSPAHRRQISSQITSTDKNSAMSKEEKELNETLIITSSIIALKQITKKLISQNQLRHYDINFVKEQIEMANVYISELKSVRYQKEDMYSQIEDVLDSIENILNNFNRKIDRPHEQRNESQAVLKAVFLQSLNLLHMKYNQLRNTDQLDGKYYNKTHEDQTKMVKDYMKERTTKGKGRKGEADFGGAAGLVRRRLPKKMEEEEDKEEIPSVEMDEVTELDSQNEVKSFISHLNIKSKKEMQKSVAVSASKFKPKKKEQVRDYQQLKFDRLVQAKDIQSVAEKINIAEAIESSLYEFEPYQCFEQVINDYFGGLGTIEDSLYQKMFEPSLSSEEKRRMARHEIVEQTLKDLVLLGKEDAMTNYKAISSIETHFKNERNLSFSQKQEQSALMGYLRTLPNKAKGLADEEDLSKMFYDDGPQFEQHSNALRYSQTVIERQRKRVGIEALLNVQELKIGHLETEIPQMVAKFVKRFSIGEEVMEHIDKGMAFYRRQLDQIEAKLIALIQKFN